MARLNWFLCFLSSTLAVIISNQRHSAIKGFTALSKVSLPFILTVPCVSDNVYSLQLLEINQFQMSFNCHYTACGYLSLERENALHSTERASCFLRLLFPLDSAGLGASSHLLAKWNCVLYLLIGSSRLSSHELNLSA